MNQADRSCLVIYFPSRELKQDLPQIAKLRSPKTDITKGWGGQTWPWKWRTRTRPDINVIGLSWVIPTSSVLALRNRPTYTLLLIRLRPRLGQGLSDVKRVDDYVITRLTR